MKQKVAIWGAAGNMGTRAVNRLREHPEEYELLLVEAVEPARKKLSDRGETPLTPAEAVPQADIVVLAIADKFIPSVAAELVPAMKSGAMLIMLDPAAAYAGSIPERKDIAIFLTHPSHPPVFNDETDPEARRDYFGSGKARQTIVNALVQGTEEDYARGEMLARWFFGPILRSHRVTLEQMAILEPALSEMCSSTFILCMREAMEAAVKLGVSRECARDFLMGHINVQLAIVFEEIDWKMSEGAYLVMDESKKLVFQPDWLERVFDLKEIRKMTQKIVGTSDS
jgi:D-apionate oxidoisomerase